MALIIVTTVLAGYFLKDRLTPLFFRPTLPAVNLGVNLPNILPTNKPTQPPANQVPDWAVVAENLSIPWAVAFLPSGEMLVTERPGNLLKIGLDKTVIKIEGVRHVGEGGLQGLTLHPNFANNNSIYLFLTAQGKNGLINRVERYQLIGEQLENRTVIIDNLPGAQFHDGGRLAFGPDQKLYITTGDASQSSQAQNLNYLGGKILRLNDDGSTPDDNPFENSPVWSYGHRNPQGLAWDDQGRLWATEHGRSGAQSGYDELNLIEAGKNYGWPNIQGDETQAGMTKPVIHSGPNSTWAPAGALYFNQSIFFTGLRGEALYQYQLETKELKTHFFQAFGRLRAVTLGPDGFFYLSTSNTDGRGSVRDKDDKIIKINPAIFE